MFKSNWVKSTLILIPGLLVILCKFILQYFNMQINFYPGFFIVSAIITLIGMYLVGEFFFQGYKDIEKIILIMVLYLIISAVISFYLSYHNFLNLGTFFFDYGLYNILVIVLPILMMMMRS